jgi:hypothetical protein
MVTYQCVKFKSNLKSYLICGADASCAWFARAKLCMIAVLWSRCCERTRRTTCARKPSHCIFYHMQSQNFYEIQDWSLNKLLSKSKRFRPVPRIMASSPDLANALDDYERSGIPLIVEGVHKHGRWHADMFNPTWFCKHGQQGQLLFPVPIA